MKLYRLLLRLYPRSFRDEYGDDMVALVRRQLRDENQARVAARTALDLAITIPARHLEARMNRTPTTLLVLTFVAVGAALAVLGGPAGLLGGVALFALAVVTWRRNRPIVQMADGRWWKLVLAGVLGLVALILVTTITGELPQGGWYIAMVTMLTSFALITAGVLLRIAARSGVGAT